MIKIKLQNIKSRFLLVGPCLLVSFAGVAQIPGSLFMSPNNFYAQIFNPSYMRKDKVIEISVAGLAGFSFVNKGSFKVSDLITTPGGKPVLDPLNFYNSIPKNNFFRQDISVPMFFVHVPIKKGALSFYYKENAGSLLSFKDKSIEYLVNGNVEPEYENFNSEAVNIHSAGYREFAFGYVKKMNKKLDIGIHAKVLFGSLLFKAEDWDFTVNTAPDGTMINFVTRGGGRLAVPVAYRLRSDSTILSFDNETPFKKYMTFYKNPGLAFDFGLNYQIDEENRISFAVRDLGFIWYMDKSMRMLATGKYDYIGFDLINAIRWPEEPGYRDPVSLIDVVKDSIRSVWQPKVLEESFAHGIGPKTMIHYQHDYSDLLSFGITNQTVFQKKNFHNTLTLSAMQKWPYLSVYESINLHGVSNISIGAGIQYELKFAQLFVATDNLIAFYHPANNKTFSLTAGICILLNNEREKAANIQGGGVKNRTGKFSKHLPYYEQLPALKRK